MRSSGNRLYVYEKNQLVETICQLRFPTILSIDTREPADFQDRIRAEFPRYHLQMDTVAGTDGQTQQVLTEPSQAYTRKLMSAVPKLRR